MRVLVLAPFPPRLDAPHGGARAVACLIAGLTANHDVGLLYLRGFDEPPVERWLTETCGLVEEVPRRTLPGRALGRWARRVRLTGALLRGRPMWVTDYQTEAFAERLKSVAATWSPDVIHLEMQVMGQYVAALAGSRAPRVLRVHDPGTSAARTAKSMARGRGMSRIVAAADAWAWNRFEKSVVGAVQALVVLTERDRAALVGRSTQRVVCIPLATPLPWPALDPLGAEPPMLLFAGSFAHLPNLDAADRLARAIFPPVHAELPGSSLHLVGPQPPAHLHHASAGVIVTGQVPDLTPYLDRAAVVVAPLRLGGGMRVKVLEALSAGKAVVASPLAVAGLDVAHGQQVILAETDAEFSQAIMCLLRAPSERAALATRARAWAHQHLRPEQQAARHAALYAELLRDSGGVNWPATSVGLRAATH